MFRGPVALPMRFCFSTFLSVDENLQVLLFHIVQLKEVLLHLDSEEGFVGEVSREKTFGRPSRLLCVATRHYIGGQTTASARYPIMSPRFSSHGGVVWLLTNSQVDHQRRFCTWTTFHVVPGHFGMNNYADIASRFAISLQQYS